jgi:hypothetical protein
VVFQEGEGEMVKVSGVLGEGPLVAFADGYRAYLDQRGYSRRAVRERLELLGQLSLWLVAEELSTVELTRAQAQR